MDTSRALYDADDRTQRSYYDGEGRRVWDTGQEPIPLHPHNAAVQGWLELGVVGAAALALVLVTAVRAVAASAVARTDKAVCLAVFVTGFTIASLSYGIWQGWWLGALWLAAAFTVAAARPRLPT
jgi:O-antigen ligase